MEIARSIVLLGLLLLLIPSSGIGEVYQCNGVWTSEPCEQGASKTLLSRKENPTFLKREKEVQITHSGKPIDVSSYQFSVYDPAQVFTVSWYHKKKQHFVLNRSGGNIEYCKVSPLLYKEFQDATSHRDVYMKELRAKPDHECAPWRRKDNVAESIRSTIKKKRVEYQRPTPEVFVTENVLRETGLKQKLELSGAVSGNGRVKLILYIDSLAKDGTSSGRQLKQTRTIRLPDCGGSKPFSFTTTIDIPSTWSIIPEYVEGYNGCDWSAR